jgi:hypothetical protein
MSPRWRLILAGAAFLGWLAYLGYAAATKSHAPIVSHSQASAATAAVVAEVTDGPAPTIAVVEKLWGEGPTGPVEVVNLPDARGFTGPGKYLLYLFPVHDGWAVVSPPRSPEDRSKDMPQVPLIYPWSDDVRKQDEKLRPKQ